MFSTSDFHRLIAPVKSKLQLMIGRAVLAALDNTGKAQKMQVRVMADEDIDDMERYQEYGLETYPKADAEVLMLFQGGARELGIAVCVQDKRYRPTDLEEGEVCLYTHAHAAGAPHRVLLKTGRKVILEGASVTALGNGAGTIKLGSEELADLYKLVDERVLAFIAAHTHTETAVAGAQTGPPSNAASYTVALCATSVTEAM